MGQSIDRSELKEKALRNEGYLYEGLTFYPITVKHYGVFLACESALTLRMSMLPAVYASKNFASAIFEMQIEEIMRNGKNASAGYWSKFLRLMCLSLRIPPESAAQSIQMRVNPESPKDLIALIVRQISDETGEAVIRLEPTKIARIREIIAIMNGKELPDEADNSELIQAEMDIASINAAYDLVLEIDDLKASVARDQRIRLHELDEWTILEFDLLKRAIEREKRFLVCGIGESSGMVKWKGGNPYPSPFFDRKRESSAVQSAQKFQERISGAVATTDSLPTKLPI